MTDPGLRRRGAARGGAPPPRSPASRCRIIVRQGVLNKLWRSGLLVRPALVAPVDQRRRAGGRLAGRAALVLSSARSGVCTLQRRAQRELTELGDALTFVRSAWREARAAAVLRWSRQGDGCLQQSNVAVAGGWPGLEAARTASPRRRATARFAVASARDLSRSQSWCFANRRLASSQSGSASCRPWCSRG